MMTLDGFNTSVEVELADEGSTVNALCKAKSGCIWLLIESEKPIPAKTPVSLMVGSRYIVGTLHPLEEAHVNGQQIYIVHETKET